MTFDLDDSPPAGQDIEAVDVTQLLEAVRKLTNWVYLDTFAATYASAATTFTALGGTSSVSFTKLGDSTTSNILAFLIVSAWKSTTIASTQFAISDGTTDWRTHDFGFNSAAEHMSYGIGSATMTGLAAGTYTLQVKARCKTAVAGVLNVDTDDELHILAMEVGA